MGRKPRAFSPGKFIDLEEKTRGMFKEDLPCPLPSSRDHRQISLRFEARIGPDNQEVAVVVGERICPNCFAKKRLRRDRA